MDGCPDHRRYRGFRRPRRPCYHCWLTYANRHPNDAITADDLASVTEGMQEWLAKCLEETIAKERQRGTV